MSNTEYNAHDQQVVAELEKLGNGTTSADYFARALELDATPALLTRIADNYLTYAEDGHTVIGLPYVDVLVEAGWRGEQIRPMLDELCFNESNSDLTSYHREGFLRARIIHAIFSADAYVAFMKKMAATYNGARFIMTEFGNEVLEGRLNWLRNEHNQVQRDIREIEAVAAGHLSFIEDEYQLRQMIRYASSGRDNREIAKNQTARATQVANHGWNLVFRGYVLSKIGNRTENMWLVRDIYEMFRIRPNWAASTYRWLLEGFYRADNEYWQFRVEESGLKAIFEHHEWVFARVRQVGNHLQVAVTFKGQRATIKHVPGDETLEAGDEVIVSAEQLKGLTPRHQPGGKVYELTLTPARRPTPDQLANHKDYFPSKR
jgi:hypothetical protein